MSRYARGDETAFDLVYETVAPRLERYLGRRVPARPAVEDIVQQTFLQMHAARATFTSGAAVLPWAYAIARRLMIDAGRASRRERPAGFENDLPSPSPARVTSDEGSSPTSEQVLQAEETHAHLAAAYERLSPAQRDAFDLVKIESEGPGSREHRTAPEASGDHPSKCAQPGRITQRRPRAASLHSLPETSRTLTNRY